MKAAFAFLVILGCDGASTEGGSLESADLVAVGEVQGGDEGVATEAGDDSGEPTSDVATLGDAMEGDGDAVSEPETAAEPDTTTEAEDVPVTLDVAVPVDVPVAVDVGTPAACPIPTTAGHHDFDCDEIHYDLEIPKTCPEGGCGLIVDIHGLSMSGDQEEKNTEMRVRGPAAGYIVLQPTAPGIVGLVPSWDQDKHAPRVFDVLSATAEALGADLKRIHSMGFSQGGGMTWRLICEHAGFFASGAPLGALEGCAFMAGVQSPGEEIDMLVVHGRNDAVVNFSVAESQRDKALKGWPFGAGTVVSNAEGLEVTKYETPTGTVMETWWHDYESTNGLLKGHCVPGSQEFSGSLLNYACEQAGTFVYAVAALEFFQAHPRP